MLPISRVKLPPSAVEYLSAHELQWGKHWYYSVHLFLRHFYLWLRKERISIRALTPAHVRRFMKDECFATSKIAVNTIILRSYLIWLIENEKSRVNFHSVFPDYARWNPPLPSFARQYVDLKTPQFKNRMSQTRLNRSVGRFHRWVCATGTELKDIRRVDLETFLAEYLERNSYNPSTLHGYRSTLRGYLDWLVDNGRMSDIDLSIIFPRGKNKSYRRLSSKAKQFLATLPAAREPKTCFQYKAALSDFYSFLHERKIHECHISRKHTEIWMNGLQTRGLKPGTRLAFMLRLRSHFTWMAEHGHLRKDPYDLIRIADLPRLPKRLPRPLPHDVDHVIQRRLAQSDSLYDLALLLLRRTGIRIGELIMLPSECVKKDHGGNWALKVPLGKMHNERLVPLNATTLALIRNIQTKSLDLDPKTDHLIPNYFKPVTLYARLRNALAEISADLKTSEHITPHRLRHSFATELLNGGMSMYGLMRILGHRSTVTTQIYADVAQETIRGEYFQALDKVTTKYVLPQQKLSEKNPIGAKSPSQRKRALLLKRMHRLKSELDDLEKSVSTP